MRFLHHWISPQETHAYGSVQLTIIRGTETWLVAATPLRLAPGQIAETEIAHAGSMGLGRWSEMRWAIVTRARPSCGTHYLDLEIRRVHCRGVVL